VKRLGWILLFSCRSQSAPDAAPAASSALEEPSVSAVASVSATPEASDFEDQFLRGRFDAGASDPTRLAAKYEAYANGRYGYTVDVPESFVAMPDPMNQDGRHWRLGRLAAVTVSGKKADADTKVSCPSSPDVMEHGEKATACWATGKHDGWIFWQREALAHGTLYLLQIQYVETLKVSMDPIVKHVNASWQY
jgi:hypothetical protein